MEGREASAGRRLGPWGPDLEDRVLGRDAAHLLVRRVWTDALEEWAHLPLPSPQVGAQDRWFVLVRHLGRRERLAATSHQKSARSARPEVSRPLRVAAWGDEVQPAVKGEHVDGRAPELTARAPGDLEDTRSGDADSETRQGRNDRVEQMPGEPVGATVVLGHVQVRIVADALTVSA
jgi:hypothetical protein